MYSVAIVGGTGYTGVELVRLLLKHPQVTIKAITSRGETGKRLDAVFPSLRGLTDICFVNQDIAVLEACNVVFFATPHGVAMSLARALTAKGVKIIDLAADFRLKDTAVFEQWYGMAHACPDVLATAVYGLPEYNRADVAQASVIGNPGCYPTTVQLGLLPLILGRGNAPLIETDGIIVDAKSGVSGAGRKAELSLLYTEASDNFKAYAIQGHRHHPEIVQGLNNIAGTTDAFNSLIFTPHLVPMIRGMLSTIYVKLTDAGCECDLQALYEACYQHEPFVDVMPAGASPETRSVRGANMLRIALCKKDKTLVILVAQDNLVKGAAGQAIQNMNIMLGLPEVEGLAVLPLLP